MMFDNTKPKHGTFIDVPVGGITSYSKAATVVVAASNSKDTSNADYVCDGTDDDVEIQAAIDSLPASGGRVLLLEGTYVLGSSLNILKSNVSLEGQGNGTVIKGAISNSYIIVGDGSTTLYNIKISNLRIDGTDQTSGHGIYFRGGSANKITNSVVYNCLIENCVSYGIYLYYSDNNIVTNNYCYSQNTGIRLDYSTNNIINGNNFKNNSVDGIGIYNNSNNNTIIGNYCENRIRLYYSDNNVISNNIIDSAGTGIYSECNNNLYIGNVLRNCTTPFNIQEPNGLMIGNVVY